MPSARYWREIPTRFRLEAVRCKGCGHVSYPARQVCPSCRATAMEPTALSHSGKVVTSTVIHVPPNDLVMEAPYAVAIVETPEKVRLTAQVADCDPGDVRAGMEVRLEFRRIRREGHGGILCYGVKAVPTA